MATDATALLLTMSADTSKALKSLDALNARLSGLAPEFEKHGKKAAAALERGLTGEGFGKALDKVFDASRLAVLEEGSAKIRVFGSALEPLGPLGIAAAAGITAIGVSLEEAHKAVEYADNLYKLAKNAHVTTDELQELQFALRVSGGNAADASEGLQSFSAQLGKAQAGLLRAQRPFLELGFSKEQIKGFDDAGTALVAVTEKIANLKSPAQKDAVIEQLGLQNLKPLIEGGVEKMRELMAEAQATGLVLDSALVKRGHELNEQLETLHTKVDVDLKTAFIDLGPILVGLSGLLADMAGFAADVAESLKAIEDKRTSTLQARLKDLQSEQPAPPARGLRGPAASGIAGVADLAAAVVKGGQNIADFAAPTEAAKASEIARIQAELAKRAAEKPPTPPSGGGRLNDVSPVKKGPADQTSALTKTAEEDAQRAAKGLAEAYRNLTGDIDERAKFEVAANNDAAAAEQAKLNADLERLLADKSIDGAVSDQLQAKIEQAKLDVEATRVAKNQLAARLKDYANEDRVDETRRQQVEATIAQLQAAAAQATTAAERTKIEADILRLKQDEYRHELGKQLSRQVETGALSQTEADKRFAAGLSTLSAQKGEFDKSHETSVQRYLDSLKDVDSQMQDLAVTASKDLSSGLADAIVNAKNLGQVASSVFRQIIASLLQQSIEKSIVGPILGGLFHVPGFASGTDFAPGGMALVGEHGPELVNLPRGSQVFSTAKSLAMSSRDAQTLNLSINLNAQGAGPREVDVLKAQVDDLKRSLPGTIVATMADARSRGRAGA